MNYAIQNGMIDEEAVYAQIEMKQREQYLKQHCEKYAIWFSESANKWITYLPDEGKKEKRRKVRRGTRRELEDEIVKHYKEKEDNPTVEEVFYRWIDRRLHEYADFERQTANRYVNDFKRFIKPAKFSQRKIKTITEYDVVDFIRQFSADETITAKVRANVLILLKGTFQYAKEKGLSSISLHAIRDDFDIRSHKRNKKRLTPGEDIFLDEEVQKIKEYIEHHTDDIVLLGILMVIHTGLRVGELAALKWSDFDLERHLLTVCRTEIKYQDENNSTVVELRESTKGATGWRIVVISDEAIRILNMIRKLNPDGEYLFMEDRRRINANAWTKKLPRLCAKLGIGKKKAGTDRVNGKSIHKLRKYYVSKLIEAHVDPVLLTMQAGHVDLGTSYNFYYRNTKSIEETASRLIPALNSL